MEKPTGVLFDCNGVIIDDYFLQKNAWNVISLELRNKPITDTEMIEHVLSVPTIEIGRWISNNTLSEDELFQLGEKKRKIHAEIENKNSLYSFTPGIPEFFDALQEMGIPMTIVTSARESGVREYFEEFNFGKWFEWNKIVYNDGLHNNKPAPDPYVIGARKLGLMPEECMVFEDSIQGIISGYSAGSRNIVGVARNISSETLRKQPGVIRVIEDFYQITPQDFFTV